MAQLNAIRSHAGLRPLRANGELTAAARGHSVEMTELGYFSHDSADGDSMADRVRSSYAGGHRWEVGENLLWSSPTVGSTRAVTLWMASPEHRANILTRVLARRRLRRRSTRTRRQACTTICR